MTRLILIFVSFGIVFAGLEGTADAAGTVAVGSQDHGHEVHDVVHTNNHEHDGDSDHDDHFCHCSVHAVALPAATIMPVHEETFFSASRYDSRFSSLAGPPLLRPPNN